MFPLAAWGTIQIVPKRHRCFRVVGVLLVRACGQLVLLRVLAVRLPEAVLPFLLAVFGFGSVDCP